MHIETPLIAVGGSLIRAIEGLFDSYSLLYALIVFVLIPVASFVASQACAAIVGHYALHICMRKAREEKAALQAANKNLQEQNCRLMAVNALLVADRGRLGRANKRLLKRALKAELILAAREQSNKSHPPSPSGMRARQPAEGSGPCGMNADDGGDRGSTGAGAQGRPDYSRRA